MMLEGRMRFYGCRSRDVDARAAGGAEPLTDEATQRLLSWAELSCAVCYSVSYHLNVTPVHLLICQASSLIFTLPNCCFCFITSRSRCFRLSKATASNNNTGLYFSSLKIEMLGFWWTETDHYQQSLWIMLDAWGTWESLSTNW
jgi:hypothetical protein